MFSIGEFSKLGRVTIDTLRHYDALGLLKPVNVDPFTGYRYYSARQLMSLNRIIALKEIGFSLNEIARILQDNLTSDQLQGMLKAQLVRAESDVQTARLRQERILARLNYLKMEDNMPTYEVTLKAVDRQTMAAMREIVPTIEQMPERCGAMFDAIAKWMSTNNVAFGPSLTIYHNETYTREDIDTECAFLLPDATAMKWVKPDERIKVKSLEPLPMVASTIVTDDFYKRVDGLKPAYDAIAKWIEEHHYRLAGNPRELFYGSPATGDLTAEIQFPVDKG